MSKLTPESAALAESCTPYGGDALTDTEAELIDALSLASKSLPDRDVDFAGSLIRQYRAKGWLSDNQWPWVHKLIERATAGPAEAARVAESIGEFAPMMVMFRLAARDLKRPKTRIFSGTRFCDATRRAERGLEFREDDLHGFTLILSVAGERAKFPGSINVVDMDTRVWFGRITEDGLFHASPRVEQDEQDDVVDGLRRFAKDPAQAAAAYGRLMGHCCFCSIELSDARSTKVGYGPVCAKHYGLPWGDK